MIFIAQCTGYVNKTPLIALSNMHSKSTELKRWSLWMKMNFFLWIHHQHITTTNPNPILIICKILPPEIHQQHDNFVNKNNLSSSFYTKIIPSSEQQNSVHAITYSTPSPIFITTSIEPQDSIEHPVPPIQSYDYQDIIEHSSTPSPEYHTVKVTTYTPDEKHHQTIKSHHQSQPDRHSSSLSNVLTKLQKSNHLPATLTPDNVDGSIKTLVKILNKLEQNEIVKKPPPVHTNHADDDYDYSNDDDDDGTCFD